MKTTLYILFLAISATLPDGGVLRTLQSGDELEQKEDEDINTNVTEIDNISDLGTSDMFPTSTPVALIENLSTDWTTISSSENDSRRISIKDVFENALDAASDEIKGISIIQSWLKHEQSSSEEQTQEEVEEEVITTSTELSITSDDQEIDKINVIEEDLRKLQKINDEEEKKMLERSELLEEIEENIRELENGVEESRNVTDNVNEEGEELEVTTVEANYYEDYNDNETTLIDGSVSEENTTDSEITHGLAVTDSSSDKQSSAVNQAEIFTTTTTALVEEEEVEESSTTISLINIPNVLNEIVHEVIKQIDDNILESYEEEEPEVEEEIDTIIKTSQLEKENEGNQLEEEQVEDKDAISVSLEDDYGLPLDKQTIIKEIEEEVLLTNRVEEDVKELERTHEEEEEREESNQVLERVDDEGDEETFLSSDHAIALQIAAGALGLCIVALAGAILAYRKLRNKERIFKVDPST